MVEAARRKAGHPCDRAKKMDEDRHMIRSHVENGAASGRVVEAGVRMPPLVAGAEKESRSADGLSQGAFVHQSTADLMAPAKKRVRRAADAQFPGRGLLKHKGGRFESRCK